MMVTSSVWTAWALGVNTFIFLRELKQVIGSLVYCMPSRALRTRDM